MLEAGRCVDAAESLFGMEKAPRREEIPLAWLDKLDVPLRLEGSELLRLLRVEDMLLVSVSRLLFVLRCRDMTTSGHRLDQYLNNNTAARAMAGIDGETHCVLWVYFLSRTLSGGTKNTNNEISGRVLSNLNTLIDNAVAKEVLPALSRVEGHHPQRSPPRRVMMRMMSMRRGG